MNAQPPGGMITVNSSESSTSGSNLRSRLSKFWVFACNIFKPTSAQAAEGEICNNGTGGELLSTAPNRSEVDGAPTSPGQPQQNTSEVTDRTGRMSHANESSDPIESKAKWSLSSHAKFHSTTDWSLIPNCHPIPPIGVVHSTGATVVGRVTECGYTHAFGSNVKMTAVKYDPLGDGNWISVGALVRHGCKVEYQGASCTIEKDGKVIGEGSRGPDESYLIDRFDDTTLGEGRCPGCVELIQGQMGYVLSGTVNTTDVP